ncbi:hypothetical protein MFIFM68171_07282 [Madurella fahalii]|uniref:C2H2-type domain-containing protein n=1 Tax=Madurella fahalii TaxID=1157608 RepID=A0ABQ0GH45_9PEZI
MSGDKDYKEGLLTTEGLGSGQQSGGSASDDGASEPEDQSIFAFQGPSVLRVSAGDSQSEPSGAKRPTLDNMPVSIHPSRNMTAESRTFMGFGGHLGEPAEETGNSDMEYNDNESDITNDSEGSLIEAFEDLTPSNLQIISDQMQKEGEVVDRMSSRLQSMMARPCQHGTRQHPAGNYSGSGSSTFDLSRGVRSSWPGLGTSRRSRRQQIDEVNDDHNSGRDDSDDEKNKRGSTTGGRRFACPVFKRYPESDQLSKVCYGPGWPDMHRLKEHLEWTHLKPPFLCHRCQHVFEADMELSGHLQQQLPCDKREPLGTTKSDPSTEINGG